VRITGKWVAYVSTSRFSPALAGDGNLARTRTASSPIITVGYWLRGPCSPRWNSYLAGLGHHGLRTKGLELAYRQFLTLLSEMPATFGAPG